MSTNTNPLSLRSEKPVLECLVAHQAMLVLQKDMIDNLTKRVELLEDRIIALDKQVRG